MAALQLTLDYPLTIVSEPGFGRDLTARQLASLGQSVADAASPSQLWADPLTNTIMLRPLQFNADWLNTAQAGPSIVRLANMVVNPTDLSSTAVFESAAFGNQDDPWIYHIAVPTGYFPTAPNPEQPFPTTTLSLTGISTPVDPTLTDLVTIRPNAIFSPSTTVPPASSLPAASQIGGTTSGRHVAETATKFPANRAFYVRWYQAPSRLGFPSTYIFYIAQFKLEVKEQVIQLFQDVSAHGDRSAWRHVGTYPLWSVDQYANTGFRASWMANMVGQEFLGHDRSLLWLPFRRNQVLLMASSGKAFLIQTTPTPVRLADNSDWNITRADSILVWVQSPHFGRFQIQTVAYSQTAVTLNTPEIVLDYTPNVAPASRLAIDADHGTSISAAQSSPPSYVLPVNNANDCPTINSSLPSYQARHYGYQLTFQSADGNWTPFFYNLEVTSPTTFAAATATPTTVNDTASGNQSYIVSAKVSAGKRPGEGRATIEVEDFNTFPLAGYYYRSGQPVQLTRGGVAVFTGITLPQEVTPLKLQTTTPRRITFSASDRWYQMTNSFLRDTRAWGGVGHIDAVQTIMQLAGIDTTGMETPAKTAQTNTILGGGGGADPFANQVKSARDYQQPWQPAPLETAAAFATKIAEKFAGWEIGFKPDGTAFYRPRYFYTTSEVTLYETAAAATADGHTGAPLYRSPVTFTTEEPEANVILVKAYSAQDGSPLYSSLWVDFASIVNPAVKNYCGRRKTEIVELAGTYSCSEINYIARKIWDFTRRRHIMARFACEYSALIQVGHVLTLSGYGDYRVQSYEATFQKSGFHSMVVEAEFVETGVGL